MPPSRRGRKQSSIRSGNQSNRLTQIQDRRVRRRNVNSNLIDEPIVNAAPVSSLPLPTIVSIESTSSDNNTSNYNVPTSNADFETTPISSSYMDLELAISLVPRFDVKSCSLLKFIKQSKLADSVVDPRDRKFLFLLIRSKIEGQTDQLLNMRGDPADLHELISLLKKIFFRAFDVHHILDELRELKQKDDESIEYFSARVREILDRGMEAIEEQYQPSEAVGVRCWLNNAAIRGFTRGLKSSLLSALITRDEPGLLGDAVSLALHLEKETENRKTLFGINQSSFYIKASTRTAKIHTIPENKLKIVPL